MIETLRPRAAPRPQSRAAGGGGPRPRADARARGRGLGQDRVLTTRIARLIDRHGVPPDRIFAVTFTNKAAGEMKHRIGRLLDRDPSGLWIGTFHSLSARLLRREAAAARVQPSVHDLRRGRPAEPDPAADGRSGAIRPSCSRPARSVAHLRREEPDGAAVGAGRRRSQFDRLAQVAADVYAGHGPGAQGGERDGLRRPAAASAHAVPRASRPAAARTSASSATCWWTSSRTPTGPSTS